MTSTTVRLGSATLSYDPALATVEALLDAVADAGYSASEVSGALQFVSQYEAHLSTQNVATPEARIRAWQALCRAILSSNEFVYVE